MITNIGTVAIYVDDQHKAKKFWMEKVGFVIVAEYPMGPNAYWLELGPEKAKSRIVIYPKAMMQGFENFKASIVFECDDIFGTYQRMKEKGVQFKSEPQEMQWGTFVQFCDEDENEFLLKGQ